MSNKLSNQSPMPHDIRVNEGITEYAIRVMYERDQLREELALLKQENQILKAARKQVDAAGAAVEEQVAGLVGERDRIELELEECIRGWSLTTSHLRQELAQERERVKELGVVTNSGVVWNKNGNPHQQPVGTTIAAISSGEGAKKEETAND